MDRAAVDERSIHHRVLLVRRTKIAVGMPSNNPQRLLLCVKTMQPICPNHEQESRLKREVAVPCSTYPAARVDHADADRRMGVGSLIGAGREMQEIEAGIAPHNRTHQQGVGATVDVAQTAGRFDRSAEMKEAPVADPRDNKAATFARKLSRSRDRKVHPRCQLESPHCRRQNSAASLYKTEVGAVVGESQLAAIPDRDSGRMSLVLKVEQLSGHRWLDDDDRLV